MNDYSNIYLTDEQIEEIQQACVSDYIKVIQYLEEKELQNKSVNKILFSCTVLSTLFSAIAAVAAVLALLH